MPRIIKELPKRRQTRPELVDALADELRSSRPFGQPMIHEQRFPKTNAIRTTVIWDDWESISDEERAATILDAYEKVEGTEFREHLALVIGLTFPEARDAGLLPFQVVTALRDSDPVTRQECHDAMIRQGASTLDNSDTPELRFATAEEAEQCILRLVNDLPASRQVWIVNQDVARIGD